MDFAENFRNTRKAAGMTQEQPAKKLCVDRSLIAKYETGANAPNVKNLQQICDALNVTVNELLSD